MRKGEEKRREMLVVAERLFCLKGYDATSIQDILDVLQISKGGFYHYFASKEALLESIFLTRAEHAVALAESSVIAIADPMDRLNGVLAFFMPLRKDDKAFMAMLLPLMERQEGQALRLCYQETLEAAFRPLLEREIDAACKCWLDAALHILASAKKGQEHNPAALLGILDQYRRAVEVLLDAPYGSVEVVDLKEWSALAEILSRRMRLPMQG